MDSADERTRRRLRELREQAGLSLEEVGRHAGMAASTVSRLESGARRLTLGHTLPAGSLVRRVRVNGKRVRYRIRPTNRGVEVLAWAKRARGRHVLVVQAR